MSAKLLDPFLFDVGQCGGVGDLVAQEEGVCVSVGQGSNPVVSRASCNGTKTQFEIEILFLITGATM